MIFNGLERKDNSDPKEAIFMNLPNLAQKKQKNTQNNEVPNHLSFFFIDNIQIIGQGCSRY